MNNINNIKGSVAFTDNMTKTNYKNFEKDMSLHAKDGISSILDDSKIITEEARQTLLTTKHLLEKLVEELANPKPSQAAISNTLSNIAGEFDSGFVASADLIKHDCISSIDNLAKVSDTALSADSVDLIIKDAQSKLISLFFNSPAVQDAYNGMPMNSDIHAVESDVTQIFSLNLGINPIGNDSTDEDNNPFKAIKGMDIFTKSMILFSSFAELSQQRISSMDDTLELNISNARKSMKLQQVLQSITKSLPHTYELNGKKQTINSVYELLRYIRLPLPSGVTDPDFDSLKRGMNDFCDYCATSPSTKAIWKELEDAKWTQDPKLVAKCSTMFNTILKEANQICKEAHLGDNTIQPMEPSSTGDIVFTKADMLAADIEKLQQAGDDFRQISQQTQVMVQNTITDYNNGISMTKKMVDDRNAIIDRILR